MTFLRLPLVLFLTFALFSCSDDGPTGNDDDGGNNNNTSSFSDEVTATLNGDAWTASNYEAFRADNSAVLAVTLAAHGPGNSDVAFGVAFASEKTFTIEEGSGVEGSFEYEGVTYGSNETGTITISTLTSKGMKGSFTINAESSTGEKGTAVGTFDVSF